MNLGSEQGYAFTSTIKVLKCFYGAFHHDVPKLIEGRCHEFSSEVVGATSCSSVGHRRAPCAIALRVGVPDAPRWGAL
jgi:hypothetical protein